MSTHSVVVQLRAEVAQFVQGMTQSEQATNRLTNQIGVLGAGMTGLALLAVKRFADFDQAMSNVAATGDGARKSLDALHQAALDAGQRTVYSATEAAGAIEELAKAGLSASDILGGALDGSLDLAAAGALSVADAAGYMSVALAQFNLHGDQASHVADLLAAGAGKALGEVDDLGMALKQGGLVAAQTGLSIEETTAALAAFAKAGLSGSDAGTSLKTMLQRLTPQSDEAQAKFDELGISAYDASGNFVGLTDFAGQLKTKMADLTPEARNAALAVMFGSDAVRGASVLFNEGAEGIKKWVSAVNDQGYAAEVAATRLDNLKGDLEQLSGAFDTALINMGEGADGPLRSIVQKLTDVVNGFSGMSDGAQTAALAIVGGGGLVLLGIAGLGKLAVALNNTRVALVALGVPEAGLKQVAGVLGDIGMAAVGIVAAAAATGMLVTQLTNGDVVQGANALKSAVEDLADTGDVTSLDAQFSNFGKLLGMARSSVDDLGSALKTVTDESLNAKGTRAFEWIPGIESSIEIVESRFKQLDATLAAMASGGNAQEASDAFTQIRAAAEQQGISVEKLAGIFPQYTDAIIGVQQGTTETATAQDQLTQAVERQSQAWRDALGDADQAFIDLGQMYDGIIQKNQDFAQSTADTTNKTSDSWQDYYDGVSVSAKDYIKNLENQVQAQADWRSNIIDLSSHVAKAMTGDMRTAAEQMIDELIKLGPEGAAQVQTLHDLSAKQFKKVVKLWSEKGTEAVAEFTAKVEGFRQPQIPVDADLDPASDALNHWIALAGGRHVKITVDAVHGKTYQYSPGGPALFDGGGYTGPGRKYQPAGIVHADEFVVQASSRRSIESRAPGLLDAMNQTGAGALGYADGGRVRYARNQVADAREGYDLARDELAAAKRSKGKAADARRARAQEAFDDAKSALDDAKAMYARVIEATRALKTDVRRGDTRDQAASGLSGAYSVIDQLSDASRNPDLSKKARRNLADTAKEAEAGLKRLYKQADLLEGKLSKAADNVARLQQIKDTAVSGLTGAFGLGDTILAGQAATDGTAGSWKSVARMNERGQSFNEQIWDPGTKGTAATTDSATSAGIVAAYKARANKIAAFVTKLQKLRGMGLNGALLQEIYALGTEQGTVIADALIKGGKGGISALNTQAGRIDYWAGVGGTDLTKAFYTGGIAAAQGFQNGLESDLASNKKSVAKWAKALEKELKKAWGIASPSKVTYGMARFLGKGTELGLIDSMPAVMAAARRFSGAAIPAMSAGGGGSSAAGRSGPLMNVEQINVHSNSDAADAARKTEGRLRDSVYSGGLHRLVTGGVG